MSKLTKREIKILERVRAINARGGLAGLRVNRLEVGYDEFAERLVTKGLIEWVEWTPELGAGWRIKESG